MDTFWTLGQKPYGIAPTRSFDDNTVGRLEVAAARKIGVLRRKFKIPNGTGSGAIVRGAARDGAAFYRNESLVLTPRNSDLSASEEDYRAPGTKEA